MKDGHISAVIPTYQNTELLLKNLKHNLPYLAGCEIIVINDNPKHDLSSRFNAYPQVRLLQNRVNLGFSGAMNVGVNSATGSYLLFLNDDVKLLNDSYRRALADFKSHPNLFAVSFAQKERDDRIVGRNRVFFRNGFIQHNHADPTIKGETGWAEGGSCMVHREKFDALGGFDIRFAPFYWEDIDLSYRAKKGGFDVLFDPQILVEHHHETTISTTYSRAHIQSIAYRNQLLFIWKNVSDLRLIARHKWSLFKLLVKSLVKGDRIFLEGFFQAMKRFPDILVSRFVIRSIRSDYEILSPTS